MLRISNTKKWSVKYAQQPDVKSFYIDDEEVTFEQTSWDDYLYHISTADHYDILKSGLDPSFAMGEPKMVWFATEPGGGMGWNMDEYNQFRVLGTKLTESGIKLYDSSSDFVAFQVIPPQIIEYFDEDTNTWQNLTSLPPLENPEPPRQPPVTPQPWTEEKKQQRRQEMIDEYRRLHPGQRDTWG